MEDKMNLKSGSTEVLDVSKEENAAENDDCKKGVENQKEGNEPTESEESDSNKNGVENQKEGNEPTESEDDSNKKDMENQKEGNEPTESEEDYKCQPMFVCCCGASFQFLGQITSHKKKNCKWIYVCPHCDRVYENFAKMTEHKKTHQKPPVPVPVPVDTTPAAEGNEKDVKVEETEEKGKSSEEEKSADVKGVEKKENPDEAKPNGDDGSTNTIKKLEQATVPPKPKLQIKPVEKKIPPHFRARVPNQGPGNFMGNHMRSNMMQNPGMMNPQNFMGGFNQGMNCGMGMQPMMNMGMGNFGQMNPGMNMGFGGFNAMPNQFCGPNMGMNMGMGGPNMGGMNMGGMNMGMNMCGPNMGGMNNNPMIGGVNMGNSPVGIAQMNQGGFNPAPGSNIPTSDRDQSNRPSRSAVSRDVEQKMRERSVTPPPRRGEMRMSGKLSPPRRSLDKDSFRERGRFDYRDEDPMDRLGSERSKWKDDSHDRYSPTDRDRPSGWSKRSMTRDEFLSSSSSGFFKSSQGSSIFSKSDNPFDRNYSPRDDGPPGLVSKLGFSSNSKRDNSEPLLSRPPKMLRSTEYL